MSIQEPERLEWPLVLPGTTAASEEKRGRLADLLAEASEFEHNVMCQYLFTAFSMKKHPDEGGVTWPQLEMMRRWEANILLVARQEMEHLGLVTNLLTAIGEAPNFRRPDYPLRPNYYPINVASSLERFSPDSILRFIGFEMPRRLKPENHAILETAVDSFDQSQYLSIGQLYDEIRSLFNEIDPPYLFIGPRSAQFSNAQVIPVPVRGVSLAGRAIYDIRLSGVTDVDSANKVIEQIIEEGEGTEQDDNTSHFFRFLSIFKELTAELAADPGFAPARPVVPNPKSREEDIGPPSGNVTLITHPDTRQASELFDLAYGTMMLMLIRYFAHTDESEAEIAGLQQAVFFPMMTAVIRPLGEILTQLPAHTDGSGDTAGPTFECRRRLSLLPHRRATWKVLHRQLELMAGLANDLRQKEAYPASIRERLSMIYENIARISLNFGTAMQLGGKS